MFMEAIVIFKDVDASLFMKWKPRLILRLFNSYVKSLKACIIYLSLTLFIAVVRMELQSYTYMTQLYICFPYLKLWGTVR